MFLYGLKALTEHDFQANSINHDTSYTWTPRPDLDGFSDWETDLFYLLVVNSTNFGAPFTTNWFGIVKEVATTTSSLTTTQSTTTAATTATTLATTSATTTAAAAATPTTEGQGSGSQGLSSGAAAGVGVGVAAAVLIFAALVALFCWRKRKAARHADPVTPQDPSYHHDIAVDQVGGAKHDSSATHSADTYSGYYQQEPKYQLASTVDEGASVRYELDTGSGDRAELATHEHYR